MFPQALYSPGELLPCRYLVQTRRDSLDPTGSSGEVDQVVHCKPHAGQTSRGLSPVASASISQPSTSPGGLSRPSLLIVLDIQILLISGRGQFDSIAASLLMMLFWR